MRVSLRRSARLAAPARRRPRRARGGPSARTTDRPPARADQWRARSSGGPEDSALYSCECGCVFQAPVSASVSCPRCGGTQAW